MNMKLSSLNKVPKKSFTNKALFWDFVKSEIRGFSVSYSSFKSKQTKQKEMLLKSHLTQLEDKLSETPSPELLDDYNDTKSELETLYSDTAKGVLVRSRVQYINENEKGTRYFLNLEKQNYNKKCIQMLITEKGNLYDEKQILHEQQNFFEKLYNDPTPRISTEELLALEKTFLEPAEIKTLSDDQKAFCESEITLEECSKALKFLSNNKTPGCDGLPTEFYKFLWKTLKLFVFDSFKWPIERKLSFDQGRRIITLVPKNGKDVRYLSNWRHISILTMDYKILTKIYAIRLQKVLGDIISTDQVGYLQG